MPCASPREMLFKNITISITVVFCSVADPDQYVLGLPDPYVFGPPGSILIPTVL
jgi:hypothetical protein